MAEQLAENYHSAWAKRRKLDRESRGTVSLFNCSVICPLIQPLEPQIS